MKDTKYVLIDTTIYDYSLIEEKLTRLAAEGWHLEKAGSLGWKLRRGEPKAVRYAVTYAPSASAFNSRTTEAEEDLTDLCAQAGWVRVANQAQLHVYRNEDPNATPLETDEGERLKNIRKTMTKHFFPLEALMVGIFLMQFFMHFHTLTLYPSRTFSSPMMISTLGMTLFVAVIHTALALNGLFWLRRAQKAVDSGESIPADRFYRRFRWVVWAGLIVYLLCLMWTVSFGFLAVVLGISALVLFVTYGAISLCKYMDAPKWVNIVVPVGVTAVLMMFLMTIFVTSMDHIAMNEELPHPEELPLMLSDLGIFADTERIVLEESSSPLSSYGRYIDERAEERISYTIVDVKCPLFYDMILNEQERQFMQSASYSGIVTLGQADLWGAEYARRSQNELRDRWLICWENRIVSLYASWALTEEQITIAAEILNP